METQNRAVPNTQKRGRRFIKKDTLITLLCCCVLALSALFFAGSLRRAERVAGPQAYLAGRTQAQSAVTQTPQTCPAPQPPASAAQTPAFLTEPTAAAEEDLPTAGDVTPPAQSAAEETTAAPAPSPSKKAAQSDKTLYITPNDSYVNMLSSARDTVSYEFRLTERGVLRYSLFSNASDNGEWYVRLYQEYDVNGDGGETAMRLLNTLKATAGEEASASPGIGLTRGRYVLKVSAGSPFASALYSLDVSFVPGTGYEIEYNDARTRYTEVYPGNVIRGSASSYDQGYDVDWYMLRTYAPGTLELIFEHEDRGLGTVAFRVDLYNENMEPLYIGNSLLLSTKITSGVIGIPAGVYYISVQGRVYVDCDYKLTLRSPGDGYETEPNDRAEHATPMESGQEMLGSLSTRVSAADRDYYSFTLPSAGYVGLTMKNVKPAASGSDYVRRLTLLDGEGREIYSAMITGGASAQLHSPNVGLPAGEYYLRVDDDNLYHNSDTYSLTYTFTPSGSWEKEYNGTPEAATPLSPQIALSGTLSDALTDFDTDWFILSVEEEGELLLSFRHDDTGDDLDIFTVTLYNDALQSVGDAIVSCGNTPTVSQKFTVTPGVWYVRVTSGKYASDIRYTLMYSMEK